MLDERQPRAETISCATHSCVPFFNMCFYQGLICGRVAPLVAWEPVSAGIMLPLVVKLGEGTAGDK